MTAARHRGDLHHLHGRRWIYVGNNGTRSLHYWNRFRGNRFLRHPNAIRSAQTGVGEREMGSDRALSLLDQMLWTAFVVSGPILAAVLIVGVLISILQVATQIQEMTLTYVPKLLASSFLLIFLGPWMIGRISHFAQSLFLSIPSLAN